VKRTKKEMTDSEALRHADFIAFVHLNPQQRDGKERLTWTGVVQEELVTVRVVTETTGWQVDYVHAQAADLKRFLAAATVAELVAFTTKVREEGGAWPMEEE
jgi:hypothetical protein